MEGKVKDFLKKGRRRIWILKREQEKGCKNGEGEEQNEGVKLDEG
jgi:hypothetical protein